MKMYLYEGLDKQARSTMMLWEAAGRAIYEAQLTADEITKLFQQIDQAKGNRTLVGKGVDAGSAVMKAYNDLKTKVANSGPIKNIDAMYDQAAEKLKKATGGDQGVMQYVQKYRDFAKKHPIAQSLIYAALIGAAGISGAGAGGAAALGLLKMTDKLLQGEKFSSAAYSGIKTGALAYGASKLGDLIKNTVNPSTNTGDISWYSTGTGQTSAHFKNGKLVGDIIYNNQNLSPNDPGYKEAYKVIMDYAKQQGMTGAAAGNVQDVGKASMDAFKGGGSSVAMKSARELAQAKMAQMAQNANFESRNLSHKQVLALFERVARLNNRMLSEGRLEEGIWDDVKSGAKKGLQGVKNLAGKAGSAVAKGAGNALGAVGKGIASAAHGMTTSVTASTLQKAWEKAGKPTDSVEIEKLLQAQGVNPEVVKTVFQTNKIPVTLKADPATDTTAQPGATDNPEVFTPGGNRPAQDAGTPADAGQSQPQGQTDGDAGQPTPQGGKPLPDISKYTPEQKQQLIQLIDTAIAQH